MSEFDKIIQAQWDVDEANKLPLNTKVRIDLSWMIDMYNLPIDFPYIYEHGHEKEGVVQDIVKDVDGFYQYYIACYDKVVRGAYGRKDLVKLDT